MGFKENKQLKLKNGDRITLRNGDVLFYDEYYDKIVNSEDSRTHYTDNLLHKDRKELDIVEIKRPVDFETIFVEEDRIEDEEDEISYDELIDLLDEKIDGIKLTKGTKITIEL